MKIWDYDINYATSYMRSMWYIAQKFCSMFLCHDFSWAWLMFLWTTFVLICCFLSFSLYISLSFYLSISLFLFFLYHSFSLIFIFFLFPLSFSLSFSFSLILSLSLSLSLLIFTILDNISCIISQNSLSIFPSPKVLLSYLHLMQIYGWSLLVFA